MIDFQQELTKYQPILELEKIEDSIHNSEVQDILDILQHIAKQPHYSHSSHVSQQNSPQNNQNAAARQTQNR